MNGCASPSVVDAAKSLSQCKRPAAHSRTPHDHPTGGDDPPTHHNHPDAISHGNKRLRTSIAKCAPFPSPTDHTVNDDHATVRADPNRNVSPQSPHTIAAASRLVRLSVTKVEPSYTEPWRKLSPVSIVAVGVILTAAHPMDNDNQARALLRIVTTASNVNHATYIRAHTMSSSSASSPYSPFSVNCRVEWISRSMDLAILSTLPQEDTIHGSDDDISSQGGSIHISDRLAMPGEHVTFLGFAQTSASGLVSTGFGHGWENLPSDHATNVTTVSGTVSHFEACENHHFMLRMNVNIPTTTCAGGVIIDDCGGIVGIMGSTAECTGTKTFIPGVVVNQFIRRCKSCVSHVVSSSHDEHHGSCASETGATCTTAGDTDSEGRKRAAAQKTGRHHTTKQRWEHETEGHADESAIRTHASTKSLSSSGIASLGITGYQTLHNKALRQSFGVDIDGVQGVRITGVSHIAHAISNANYDYDPSHCNNEDSHCHSSSLKTDDVLLAVGGEPVMLDGTVRLAPGREHERVDFRWLISKCQPGTQVPLDVVRQKKRMKIHATLSAPRYLVPRPDEEGSDESPSYVIAGGCVFVPLSHAWMAESLKRNPRLETEGFHRYLQEQRKGSQQLILLSQVLADDVNLGYHGMGNLLLTLVNGQRVTNIRDLVDILVKRDIESTLEFRCTSIHSTRAKIMICMDLKQVMNSESSILARHMIDAWCSDNALSPALEQESKVKTHRHGVTCGLKTMRALRNAISETTIVVQNPKSDVDRVVSTTKRILSLSEAHKMQSAPNFSGKYVEDVGWTQVKTKHLSQLCQCGKSTRFYCICSVGVMRCKDCFLKHCRDHISNGPEEGCGVCGEKTELLAEGVDLVTTRKRKPNNPNQAVQSRCAVCRAKTCFCCSACGFEPEIPLCDVTTGRNCLAIHTSEHHSCKHDHHA